MITASVLLFYLAAALIATRFKLMELGPDETDEPAQPLRAVLQGFASGFHHVIQRPTVGLAFLVVMAVRFCFGLCFLIVLLLFQKYFTDASGFMRTGASGIAEVLAVGAAGVFVGAVITAPMVRKFGRTRFVVVLLIVAAFIGVGFVVQFTMWSVLVATFIVGFTYQASKVCMDSVVQADSDDAFVGRVFALYDTANNLCYVGAFAHRRDPGAAERQGSGRGVPGRRDLPDHRHRLWAGDAPACTGARCSPARLSSTRPKLQPHRAAEHSTTDLTAPQSPSSRLEPGTVIGRAVSRLAGGRGDPSAG